MKKIIGVVAAVLMLSACNSNNTSQAEVQEVDTNTTVVYLTRHAEKAKSPGRNPELAPKGKQRAKALADKLADIKFDQIYSTPYHRTKMTAGPIAEQQKLEITEYNVPANLLASKILKLHDKQNTLVVGHSNTVPKLIQALGVDEKVYIGHEQYGDLFIIEIKNGKSSLTKTNF